MNKADQQRTWDEAQNGFLHNCGVRRWIPGNQVWAEPAPLFRRMDLFLSSSSIGPSPKLSPEAHFALFSKKHEFPLSILLLPHLWLSENTSDCSLYFSPPLIQPTPNHLHSLLLSIFSNLLRYLYLLQLHLI